MKPTVNTGKDEWWTPSLVMLCISMACYVVSDVNNYLNFSVEDIYHTSSTVTLDFWNDTV
jgi:hypothetical protein